MCYYVLTDYIPMQRYENFLILCNTKYLRIKKYSLARGLEGGRASELYCDLRLARVSRTITIPAPRTHHRSAPAMCMDPGVDVTRLAASMAALSNQGHTFTSDPVTNPMRTRRVVRSWRSSRRCSTFEKAARPITHPRQRQSGCPSRGGRDRGRSLWRRTAPAVPAQGIQRARAGSSHIRL